MDDSEPDTKISDDAGALAVSEGLTRDAATQTRRRDNDSIESKPFYDFIRALLALGEDNEDLIEAFNSDHTEILREDAALVTQIIIKEVARMSLELLDPTYTTWQVGYYGPVIPLTPIVKLIVDAVSTIDLGLSDYEMMYEVQAADPELCVVPNSILTEAIKTGLLCMQIFE